MKHELTIYDGGTAILTDARGVPVWHSDSDDDFVEEFGELVTFEDGDDVAQYLEDSGYLDDDDELDIVEADDTGLHEALDAADDDDELDDDEE
jgi:hypothetical protein